MRTKVFTRREFLKTSTSATLAGALYLSVPGEIFGKPQKKSRVILIRHKNVLDDQGSPKADILQGMLDEAVAALTGTDDPSAAWEKLVGPDDVVGIKTNAWGSLPTPRALEGAIKKSVLGAGVDENHIGIRDQGVLRDSVFRDASALINVRPLRTHNWSGVGSLLKNYIVFVDTPSAYHADSCADLAKIWNLPHIRQKTRLNILVVLTPLFHGTGPHHFNRKYTWAYNGLLVGFDPVAIDATGVRLLTAKRGEFFGEDRPINPPPKHVFLADTRHHLGTANPENIDLIKLGWKDGILI